MGNLFSACCRKQVVVERKTSSNVTPEARIEKVPSAEEDVERSDTDPQSLDEVNVHVIDIPPPTTSETRENGDTSNEGNANIITARDAEAKTDTNQDVNTATSLVTEELMDASQEAASCVVTNEKSGKEMSNIDVTIIDEKPEVNTEAVGTGDLIADARPVNDNQLKVEQLNVQAVVSEAKMKKVRPKAAKGPRAMPRSSVSMENGGLRWSRYMEDVNSALQDSSPLLDRRFRPKAAKGCRTPMSVCAGAALNQHAFSFGDRPMQIKRSQLTVETEKSAEDKALERWSERVLQGCGTEDKEEC